MLGLIPEPPFDPKSWSGSSAHFFNALKSNGLLSNAFEVSLSKSDDIAQKLRVLASSRSRWAAKWHASVPRFKALTREAGKIISAHREASSIIQVGAWFSSGATTRRPCFSYHDGNAAMWYRHYGRGLLTESEVKRHLAWEQATYADLDGIFVMSNWLRESFIRDFQMTPRKIHAVGAGVNIDIPDDITLPRAHVPRFLMVGRDFERKGGRYLLEAFRIVRREIPEAELVVIGPELPLAEPGIFFPGFLGKSIDGKAKLREYFLSSNVYVLPSIYEPFGISLPEAMMYKLPCVTVDRCAMPEIVMHGKTGLVAQPENSESLARAMIELGKNPEQCVAFGTAGRERALANYTWESVAEKIKQILIDEYRIN